MLNAEHIAAQQRLLKPHLVEPLSTTLMSPPWSEHAQSCRDAGKQLNTTQGQPNMCYSITNSSFFQPCSLWSSTNFCKTSHNINTLLLPVALHRKGIKWHVFSMLSSGSTPPHQHLSTFTLNHSFKSMVEWCHHPIDGSSPPQGFLRWKSACPPQSTRSLLKTNLGWLAHESHITSHHSHSNSELLVSASGVVLISLLERLLLYTQQLFIGCFSLIKALIEQVYDNPLSHRCELPPVGLAHGVSNVTLGLLYIKCLFLTHHTFKEAASDSSTPMTNLWYWADRENN